MEREIILIAHNLRSTHNVGSLLRTADGLGVQHVYLTGYTPHPKLADDPRLPHIAQKITKDIHKTALGAEMTQDWSYEPDIFACIARLKNSGVVIAALEQTPRSIALPAYQAPQSIAIVVGREVEGIEPEVLAVCDTALEIPMLGGKESLNVTIAGSLALYQLRYH